MYIFQEKNRQGNVRTSQTFSQAFFLRLSYHRAKHSGYYDATMQKIYIPVILAIPLITYVTVLLNYKRLAKHPNTVSVITTSYVIVYIIMTSSFVTIC